MFDQFKLKHVLKSFEVIAKYRFTIHKKKQRSKTQKAIARIISRYRIPNVSHEYDRALGNAIAHGDLPVKCKIYIGNRQQMICVIKDSGDGFDYKTIINKLKKGEVYYQYHGAGFRYYNRNKHLRVDWGHHGKQIILFYDPLL
jgi:hypothetical protein